MESAHLRPAPLPACRPPPTPLAVPRRASLPLLAGAACEHCDFAALREGYCFLCVAALAASPAPARPPCLRSGHLSVPAHGHARKTVRFADDYPSPPSDTSNGFPLPRYTSDGSLDRPALLGRHALAAEGALPAFGPLRSPGEDPSAEHLFVDPGGFVLDLDCLPNCDSDPEDDGDGPS